MNRFHKSTIALALLTCGTMAANARGAVIISDPLTGTGTLNGSAAAVNSASPTSTWVATSSLTRSASGTAMTATTGSAAGGYLPFTPASGNVYTLEATFSNGGGSSGFWAFVGFTGPSHALPLSTTMGPWINMRTSDGGGGTTGNAIAHQSGSSTIGSPKAEAVGDGTANHTLTIMLDTTGTQWVANFLRDDTQFGTYTYATTPAIGGVTFGNYSLASATASNFVLSDATSVPEPASLGLLGLGALALLRRPR